MAGYIKDIARQLNDRAESLCRRYLSQGCKSGSVWKVGSIDNEPGSSFVVRIAGPNKGRWFENAKDERGDMLELVMYHEGFSKEDRFQAAKFAAENLLHLPCQVSKEDKPRKTLKIGTLELDERRVKAAQRFYDLGVPVAGTPAEAYLHNRKISDFDARDMRYMDSCYYRHDSGAEEIHPALLQAIRGPEGQIISVNRIYLKHDGSGKADVPYAKKVMSDFQGYGVRFGDIETGDTLILGEGSENTMAAQMALPEFPAIAGLTAHHQSVVRIPRNVKRLIVLLDNDAAGRSSGETLRERCEKIGIDFIPVIPKLKGFNDDLVELGFDAMKANILDQVLKAVW